MCDSLFQWPLICMFEEVYDSHLELISDAEDLMDEVLNTDDVLFTELLLDDCVGRNWHALSVDLSETALVYQL